MTGPKSINLEKIKNFPEHLSRKPIMLLETIESVVTMTQSWLQIQSSG